MSHYDVIIIGTGAGGGRSRTISRRRASGSCCWSAAGGCRGSRRTWSAEDVFVKNRYVSRGHLAILRRQGLPAADPLLRRRRHQALRRGAVRLRAEDFGELRHHAGISPAWPIGYEELEPYYTKAEQLYQVHGAAARTRPSRPPAPVPVPRGIATSRGSSSSPTTSRAGAPSVPRALRGDAGRVQHAAQPVHPVLPTATASRASCTPSPTPRCSAVRPALEHANVELLINAEAVKLTRTSRQPR